MRPTWIISPGYRLAAKPRRDLAFYTEILGFVRKGNIPVGDYRWLTVVSPQAPDEVESVLEPNGSLIQFCQV